MAGYHPPSPQSFIIADHTDRSNSPCIWQAGALYKTAGSGGRNSSWYLSGLIVLSLGYDLGILSPEIFAMLVLMALATTFMTGPLLDMVRHFESKRSWKASGPMKASLE